MSLNEKLRKVNMSDAIFACIMASVILLLIFKLPPVLLDMLLVLSITLGILVMMMTLYVESPLKLSSFPTMLLILTLFRLGLNVSSTKLILLDGNAGNVIKQFGSVVIQGNYIVGTVIFLILTIIQFKVISEGSGRIAEVAARFTLDAMPGKQMSIDADLNAGIIDETEAQNKREHLNDEAAFYGAMDGANKFVKGDVIAGLIITIINIIGGIGIGVLQKGLEPLEAMQKYTILTIGDGLVSQIPSLIIALSAGVLVTRNKKKGAMGTQLVTEIFANPAPLGVCTLILAFIAVMPGLPGFPFAVMSLCCGFIALKSKKAAEAAKLNPAGALALGSVGGKQLAAPEESAEETETKEKNRILADVSPMALEIGFSLVPLVDKEQGGDLIERISNIRQQVFEELGFKIPAISVKDNIELENNEYRILVRGVERSRGQVHTGYHLAINPGDAVQQIEGISTQDPAFGFDAYWIPPKNMDHAESMGYTVVDAASVITTHITKIVRDSAEELLNRQTVSDMVEKLKEIAPATVEETVPEIITISVLHRVLQNLLSEKVPVHDLQSVLETISDNSGKSKDPQVLAEFARQALKGHITSALIEQNNTLYCVTLAPQLEQEIANSVQQNDSIGILSLAPQKAADYVSAMIYQCEVCREQSGTDVALLVSPLVRRHIHNLTIRQSKEFAVLSYAEISDDINVEILGAVMPPEFKQQELNQAPEAMENSR